MKSKKTGGRIKGTPNKRTQLKNKIMQTVGANDVCDAFIQQCWAYVKNGQLQADFDALSPQDRIHLVWKIVAYTLDKCGDGESSSNPLNFEREYLAILNALDN